MAEGSHAAYCFETLTADLEERQALTLRQVQELWAQYSALPPLDRVGLTQGTTGLQEVSVAEEEVHGDTFPEGPAGQDDEDEEVFSQTKMVETKPQQPTLQLPSITRLQAIRPASGASSSTGSTSSSSAALVGNSKSSSNSSFFSFGRSKQPSPNSEQYPLFVTWNTISPRSQHKNLRGCIGTFDPKELTEGLAEYSLVAAFKDTRFPPIGLSELHLLSCSVTLLTNFTTCSSPFDWDIGRHGIRISFTSGSRRLGATYLPDVALEQGWTKDEALVSLMRKAGWSGRSRDWRDVFERGKGGVVRYEGRKATVDWPDWNSWRKWAGTLGY